MQISEQIFQEFKKVIDRVLVSPRSDFYRRKFTVANFDLKRDLGHIVDIIHVPRLTREELAATSPFDRLYVEPSTVRYIRYTSGTSDAPMLLLFRPEQRYSIPGKKPLILCANNHLDAYFFSAPRSAELPYFPPLIHYSPNISVTAQLADAYGIDAIVGLPSRMLALAKELSETTRENIHTLFIQGERFTTELVQTLKAWFPSAVFDPRYGMSEVGLFGYQCNELRKRQVGEYHCDSDYLLEISDTDTGKWVDVGVEGEILITELYESPHQIIRYRTGDAGRVVSYEKCVCNATFTFEVAGRIKHDIIKIAGGVIRTDEIERVIAELGQQFEHDFRGIVEFVEVADKSLPIFHLSLVSKSKMVHHPAAIEAARQEIAKRLFLTTTKTLADFLKEGRFASFDIIFVEMFPPETKVQRLRFKERDVNFPQ